MTRYRYLNSAALAVLALVATTLPAQAQDDGRSGRGPRAERSSGEGREARAQARAEARWGGGERPAASPRQAPEASAPRADWGAAMRARAEQRREARVEAPQPAARDGSYGANTRTRDWATQRQAREAAAQQQRPTGTWTQRSDRRGDGNRGEAGTTAGWQRDSSYGARSRDWQRERRDDARNYANGYRDGRREDWRDDRQDRQRAYANGYRAGDRSDDGRYAHYGSNFRRWDSRGWRSDNRYDWYRYRAANRSLFSLGRYYAPYRGYSYSRVNIGFRLGSLFYGNRYWINDPWRYRLPAVYGPYRWIRYYDDALLVDTYSGEVVDVINNFFW